METTQIARNVSTANGKAEILAIRDGQRVRFEFPDPAAAFRAHRKMIKAGADYLDTADEDKRSRWAAALVIR